MSKSVIAFAIGLMMASTHAIAQEQSEIAAAKEVAARDLKDPASAQFRDLRAVGTGDKLRLCGEINGKNSYGGYVGFKKFAVAANTAMIEPAPDAFGVREATLDLINHLCKDATPVQTETVP